VLKVLATETLHIAHGFGLDMREAQTKQLEVWTARPADFGATLVQDLDPLLDDSERARAARFRHEADRRAYALAHALRRSVLAGWLAVDPREICFSQAPGGRPVLLAPGGDTLFFSHARSRDVVACAVTRLAPVGIDVEAAHAGGVDEQMISRFVVPGSDIGLAQDERIARFYLDWTALEAFWKAEGKGLADGNPRVECRQAAGGRFEIWLEGDARGPRARVFPIPHSPGSLITLAICTTAGFRCELFDGNMQLFNARSAHEMLSPANIQT
jgi:phosphopantetheinyl transferase